MNIQGSAANLDIQFNSTPYASRRDVLSLLLTGCTVDQLSASSAGGATLEIALAPLLGQIEREVKDAVRVKEFTVVPGMERTRVRIGDQLTRRLSWNFQLDAGVSHTGSAQETNLEYKLTDRWSLELSERSRRLRERLETNTDRYHLDLRLRYRLPLD